MRRWRGGDIVLEVLGVLLLTAAVLKGHELLTVPAVNKDLWSWRPFLILLVELELALGIWLLSGLFKRLAWLAGLLCFGLFCCVTLYRGLTGAASCGCFGTVHVNPWITLLAVDLPALLALALFRPPSAFAAPLSILRSLPSAATLGRSSIRRAIAELIGPVPSLRRFAATAALGLAILGVTTPILALNKPAVATSTYEVLEPETWIGEELPILGHIDIGEKLRSGTWLLLFYHHDCPDCRRAILQYERMARDLAGNEGFLHIALIEVPPYGHTPSSTGSTCLHGRLGDVKEWFVTTPATVLAYDGTVTAAWEAQAPDFESIMAQIAKISERTEKSPDFRIHIEKNPDAWRGGGSNEWMIGKKHAQLCRTGTNSC
jgi:hypothetical protein